MRILLVVFLLAFTGCQQRESSSTAVASAEVAPSILSMDDVSELWPQFGQLWIDKDVDGILNWFTEDAVNVVPDFTPMRTGEEMRTAFTNLLDANSIQEISYNTEKINSYDGEAYEFGLVVQSIQPNDGDAFMTYSRYMCMWKEVNGEWKIQHFMMSPTPES